MEHKSKIFYVNGYDVPENILADDNYVRYLGLVLRAVRRVEGPVRLYLAGGATNPRLPDRTEAGEMERLVRDFLSFGPAPTLLEIVRLESAKDLRGNLEAFCAHAGSDVEATVFCEYARQDRMRFYVARLLPRARVHPVILYKGGHPRPMDRLLQLPENLLHALAWYVPGFKRLVVDPLRRRHMRRNSARRRRQ